MRTKQEDNLRFESTWVSDQKDFKWSRSGSLLNLGIVGVRGISWTVAHLAKEGFPNEAGSVIDFKSDICAFILLTLEQNAGRPTGYNFLQSFFTDGRACSISTASWGQISEGLSKWKASITWAPLGPEPNVPLTTLCSSFQHILCPDDDLPAKTPPKTT